MKAFTAPELKKFHFDATDILTTSGETEATTTTYPPPINPELPPDDDFE